jgi:Mrp family chromosome partitioning ATPase
VEGRSHEGVRKVPDIAPVAASVSLRAAEVVNSADIKFGDTLAFRTPFVELDPARRERERILPPAANGPQGNAYKMLRTQVLKRLDQLHANTLAILSPVSGAGKTLTAINLAIAIASDPTRTALLIDFDLRNPCIAKRFGIQRDVGVDDCLRSRRPLQDAMVKISGYERLTILPARERIDNSSEVLTDRRCTEAIAEMRARYMNRVLIFDLPPVLQTDDALAVSKFLQAGLVVVAEGRSQRAEITRTLDLLQDMTIIGTVLNGSRETTQAFY